MPELPDVEMFRRFLNRIARGHIVEDIVVRDEWILRGTSGAKFRKQIVGKQFTSAWRQGKYLFAPLQPQGFIVFHFGMTGFFRCFRNREIEPQYDRVVFSLDGGTRLAFNCRRRLGSVRYVEDSAQFIAQRKLGPDALRLDFESFLDRLHGKRGSVKCVLLDQSVLAGIGNIYADEILFHARLHPRTRLTATNDRQKRMLFDAIVNILNTAIDRNNDVARFPRTYLIPHRFPAGSCPRCRTRLASLRACGRTAYFCPSEQRLKH